MNRRDVNGDTALHLAASRGHIEVARALLQAGANARKSNNNGQTPLHLATMKGHLEIVRALLEAGAGADVRKSDESGMHPIYSACVRKDLEMFRALVEAGGDVNRFDSRDGTPRRLWKWFHRGSPLPVYGERCGCEQESR